MGTRDTNFLVGIKLNPSLVAGQVSLGLAADCGELQPEHGQNF